jgi:hypothetical protein
VTATAGPGPDFELSHGGDNERPVFVLVSAERSGPGRHYCSLASQAASATAPAIAPPRPITSTFSSHSGPFIAMSFRSPGGSSPRCTASVVGLCP